jgi:4-hydroxybenzoyl-CoA thioesterase
MNARKPYRAELIVRFGHIDSAGIVYYPRLVNYLHVAMEEFFGAVLATDYPSFLAEHRMGLPAARLEVDFLAPLRYGDHIQVEVGIEKVGTSSIIWCYRIFRPGEDEPAARARVVTVNVDMDTFAKQPVPDWLRQRLERYQTIAG